MKKIFFSLPLALMLALASFPVLGEEASDSLQSTQAAEDVLRTSKQANLRELPDTDSALQASLDRHAQVRVLGTLGEGDACWAYVEAVSYTHLTLPTKSLV